MPEERSRAVRSGGKYSILMFFLLVITVTGLAFLVYLKSQNVDISELKFSELFSGQSLAAGVKSQDERVICDIPRDSAVVEVYKDYIVKCTREGIKGLDKKGAEQWSIPATFNNPELKASSSSLLAADIGGKDIYVVEGKALKWTEKLEGSIKNADINASGYVAVVHDSKGYKAGVSLFNSQGIRIFTRNKNENFVLSSNMSPSCKQVLINGVDASGVTSNAVLEFTDSLGKPIDSIRKENSILSSVWYMSDGSIAAAGDNKVVYFDKERKEKWEKTYDSIYSSGTLAGKYVVAAVSPEDKNGIFDSGKAEVRVLNLSDGQQTAAYTVNDTVENLETFSDIIAVNTGREVHFLNAKGKLIGKYTSKIDILEVRFLNKQEAVIVSKNNIVVYKID